MLRRTATAVCSLALILAVGWTPAGASVLQTIGKADYYTGATKVGTYNLIYDPEAPDTVKGGTHGIVWLDYTRLAGDNVTPLYDTWQNQVDWANGLNGSGTYTITNYVLNTGYSMNWGGSSWRLPSTVDAASSFGYPPASSSEMAHLFYAEGVTVSSPSPFTNLQSGGSYWSGTEYYDIPGYAWALAPDVGYQNVGNEVYGGYYALAVRPGQLETSAVPEPSTYLLLGIALGVVGYARRRMSAR